MPAPVLVIVEQDQPYGEQGTRFSLDEVARRAGKGGLNPVVRAWAIECLHRARIEQGIACDNDRQRAEVLLKAVQKKLWVPDPVGVEHMTGGHLMACDRSTKDAVCFHGEDCDGLAILLGSCLLSVGIYVAVVGHAYGVSRSISHVLIAAWVNGQWEYADPSTTLPLGTCVKFTRERLLSVPNVKVICDANVCLTEKTAYHPERTDFVVKGVFVGVDGPPVYAPIFAWTVPMQSLGQVETKYDAAAYSASYNATVKEVEKNDGVTNQDVANIAGVAAGAAAAALCVEGGPLAAAACGTIAAAVTTFLTKAILDTFGKFGGSGAYTWGAAPNIRSSLDSSVARFFDAKMLMGLAPRYGIAATPSKVYDVRRALVDEAVSKAEMEVLGRSQPLSQWEQSFAALDTKKRQQITQRSYSRLISTAAVEKSKSLATMQTRLLPGYVAPKKKSSSLVPIALVGAAAGGLWWLNR